MIRERPAPNHATSISLFSARRDHVRFLTEQIADSNIQNIVGNVDLKLGAGETIDLQRFHATHSVFCTYQKNMFPGLIFRPLNCPVVLLLFTSGKIVLTGAKSSQSMHAGWRDIWPKIAEFIVRAPAATSPS